MDRKAICAFLIGCEPDQFMAYADKAELGSVVIGPDGKKYRYTVAELERMEKKLKPKPKPKAAQVAAKPATPAKPKAPAKRTRKPATKRAPEKKKEAKS